MYSSHKECDLFNVLTKHVCLPVFLKESARHFSLYPIPEKDEEFAGDPAHTIKDHIFSYKKKVAAKNKKHCNIDGVFLDISDCLQQSYEVDKTRGYRTACLTLPNRLAIGIKHIGNICLPFKNCYIYVNDKKNSYVVQITDKEDGTYRGKLYVSLPIKCFLQISFVIHREENFWNCLCAFDKQQRPFGQILSNSACAIHTIMSIHRHCFDCEDDEVYTDFVINECMKICLMLKHLSSYKDKQLYKVGKDLFVYSQGKNVLDYIEKVYPNQPIEKQEGWLVNGYWKFLDEKEFGKDQKGNKIKGLTWVVPHEQEEKLQINMNNQTTNLVKLHALKRAKERYNIDLTTEDLQNIVDLCLDNKGKRLFIINKFGQLKCTVQNNKAGCYRVWYNGMYLDVAIHYDYNTKRYRVCTLLPKPKDVQCTTISSKDYLEVTNWKSK
jgi:hypothetical protein